MLSRVADSLYWMSRYLERAEHTTRLLEINLNLMLDEGPASADRRWLRVLQALGKPKGVTWNGNPYALTQALTFDTGNKASILSCIISARENSRHVREQISTEQWQQAQQPLSAKLTTTGKAVRPRRRDAARFSSERPRRISCSASWRPSTSFKACHRFHDEPWGGLAVHPGRPFH